MGNFARGGAAFLSCAAAANPTLGLKQVCSQVWVRVLERVPVQTTQARRLARASQLVEIGCLGQPYANNLPAERKSAAIMRTRASALQSARAWQLAPEGNVVGWAIPSLFLHQSAK